MQAEAEYAEVQAECGDLADIPWEDFLHLNAAEQKELIGTLPIKFRGKVRRLLSTSPRPTSPMSTSSSPFPDSTNLIGDRYEKRKAYGLGNDNSKVFRCFCSHS